MSKLTAQRLREVAPLVPAMVYRSSVGMRRSFLSENDMLAYDRGYASYPVQPAGPRGTPEWSGWSDAHEELRAQLSSRPGDL
jgi:hypothetical protein